MALTATATERVRRDIIVQLGLRDCRTFLSSFDRPNLTYTVQAKGRDWMHLTDVLEDRRGQSTIVYCFSRQETEDLAPVPQRPRVCPRAHITRDWTPKPAVATRRTSFGTGSP